MQDPVALTAGQLDKAFARFLSKYAFVDHRNIRSFSEAFCKHFGITAIPRDPAELLPEHFGIRIIRPEGLEPKDPEWILDEAHDTYVIAVTDMRCGENLSLHLWHELFEILASNRRFPSRLTSHQECELAWEFAYNVAVPEDALREMADDLGHPQHQDKTGVLASRFYISFTGMVKRLDACNLGYKRKRTAKAYW